ncbi:MAG: penicillin-binding transpeptidase domain-containing protein, partial [Pseudomonadota bacterium]
PAPASKQLYRSQEARTLLNVVRTGMRDVVSGSSGTARRVFTARAPDLKSRAAGKTGTADRGASKRLGRNARNSTFAGWLDDRAGKPAFAFGCSVSLTGRRSGGAVSVPPVCAYAVAELMKRIDARVLAK